MDTSSEGAAPAVCAACGAQHRDGARFCADCGSALARRCRACAAELPAGARFCDSCGAAADAAAVDDPAGGRELRKTVTILFADLVGSTSLQETLDPESVRRVMTRFYDTARAAIDAHEGTVVKFTGDGVMAAFGTPVVREDDALRGVRAAHALVERVSALNEELTRDWGVRLQVRTGVNTGEVVVGGADGDLIGDPVNVAARLEQAAGDGEVLVGEQTERLVRRDVQLEPVAPLDLKGKAEPVPAFAARGTRGGARAGRDGGGGARRPRRRARAPARRVRRGRGSPVLPPRHRHRVARHRQDTPGRRAGAHRRRAGDGPRGTLRGDRRGHLVRADRGGPAGGRRHRRRRLDR